MSDSSNDRGPVFGRRKALQLVGVAAGALVGLACKEEAATAAPAATPAAPPAPPAPPAAPAQPVEQPPAAEPVAANAEADAKGEGLNCKTKAPIDDNAKMLRRSLQYKEKSEFPDKKCVSCAQYEAGKYAECGGCKLFGGAVNPEGYCLSYAPMPKK